MKAIVKYIVLVSLLISGKSNCQESFSIEEQLNVIRKVNSLLDNKNAENYRTAHIDSILISHKTIEDFYIEKNLSSYQNLYLSSNLSFIQHQLMGNMYVTYLDFVGRPWKIRFKIYDRGTRDTVRLLEFADSMNAKFSSDKYSIVFTKVFADVDKKINENFYREPVKLFRPDLREDVDFINDPLNALTYGIACSVSGSPPIGLSVMQSLVDYKEFPAIENLLYSLNPVTRVYAADALIFSKKKKGYKLNKILSEKIDKIYEERIVIEMCSGCSFEYMQIRFAVNELKEQMKNPYQNYIFINK